MASRKFNDSGLVDLHWQGRGAHVLVEIRRTHSARDVREALLTLSYALQEQSPPAMGLCVVVDSRLSHARLMEELARFREIVRPGLGAQMFLASQRADDRLQGDLPLNDPTFHSAVRDAIQRERTPGAARVTRQQVKAALVERRLTGLEGLTMGEARRQLGASHQTVAAALDELQELGLVGADRDGPIKLRPLSVSVLLKLADEHAAARRVMRYADPTGNARPPSAMAHRLSSLRSKSIAGGVAIGGVLGATRFFEHLNITAAPRLDLSVYDGDVRFVSKLDAGLVDISKVSNRNPVLVLHLQRDCRPPDLAAAEPERAARLDCLADLRELGLQAEAEEFAHDLYHATKEAA